MIDSGATHCFIASSLVKKHNLTTFAAKPKNVKLPDGTSFPTSTICPILININQYKAKIHCYILPLSVSDVILGKNWLTRNNPVINWRSHVMHINANHKRFTLLPSKMQSTSHTPLANCLSVKQLRKF